MRNKYKRKQLQEKTDQVKEPKIFENKIHRKELSNIPKLNIKNSIALNDKKTFNKYVTNNDLNKDNKERNFRNKNAFSTSFRRDIKHNETFNKVVNEKDNKRRYYNNLFGNENEEKNEERSYSFRKTSKYNTRENNKELILNKIKSQNNNKNLNLRQNYDLTKNNSQKFSTIFINSENNKKERRYISNRKYSVNQINNKGNNTLEIKNEYKMPKTRYFSSNINNFHKLNTIETVKKLNTDNNNISRNRNSFNSNNEYFMNRKNKNEAKNLNSNNNFSVNEKSNSLSVISEKISLLNSFEETPNQKEERESLKDRKRFSSKNKNDNSEKNSYKNIEKNKNYFNIIEIQEENENIKNDKNFLRLSKMSTISQDRKKEGYKLSPQIIHNRRHFQRSSIGNQTDVIIEDNNDNSKIKKRNSLNASMAKKSVASNSLIDNNYLNNRRGKNFTNFCGSFRELNENINNLNNLTKKHKTNQENDEQNKNGETINLENDTKNENLNIKESIPLLKVNKESVKEKEKEKIKEKEIEKVNVNMNVNGNNKREKINKEINININNNYFHDIQSFKTEDNAINAIMKKNQSLPIRSFKFLVQQANYNDIIKDSFNKYYEENKKTNDNNNNESLSISNETNFSGKAKYSNTNVFSDIMASSKREYLKSPMSSVTNFYINNENYIPEDDSNKKKSKLFKQKLIKTSRSEFFNNVMNNTYETDSDKSNFNINNFLNNRLHDNKNCNKKITNEIINNNIYSTTLNIYKFNDNNNDEFSQIKSILTPSTIRTNILYKNNRKNNDNIIKVNNTVNHNYSNSNIYKQNYISSSLQCSDDVELELFYNLEKKILLLIKKIEEYQICKNECYNIITYYFENQINEHINKLFKNNHNKINIINYMKIEILCYFLCYDIFYSQYFNQAAILIKSIMNILNDNFLLIILFVLRNYNKNNSEKNKEIPLKEKKLISDLNEIIKSNLTIRVDEESINEFYIIQLISNKTKDINNYYKMILDNLYKEYYSIKNNYNNVNYKFPDCIKANNSNNIDKKIINILFFYDSYRLLNNYQIVDLKKFFDIFLDRSKYFNIETDNNNLNLNLNQQKEEKDILHTDNSLASSNNSTMKKRFFSKSKEIPLMKSVFKIKILPDINKNKYKYTLILPFNEMLIFQYKNTTNYMIRPGLFEFLKEIKEIFELIIYSSDNAFEEQIIESFQKEKNVFDHILNKSHGIDDVNYFIQDLNTLNRNFKKFIIIDSSLNRFKIFKNNLLIIKPFYGDIREDKNSLNYLSQLLHNIGIDADTTEDVRISINKYKKSFIYSKLAKICI